MKTLTIAMPLAVQPDWAEAAVVELTFPAVCDLLDMIGVVRARKWFTATAMFSIDWVSEDELPIKLRGVPVLKPASFGLAEERDVPRLALEEVVAMNDGVYWSAEHKSTDERGETIRVSETQLREWLGILEASDGT